MKLRNRIETEDFFHDVIALILPHIEKSNIRPAFQKTKKNNPAGANYISQSGITDGLVGFTNTDDFIYFKVIENATDGTHVEVNVDDSATYINEIELTVYIYGNKAQENALLLRSLIRTERISNYLNSNGYYQTEQENTRPISEIINGEWWDRTDVTLNFTCRIDLPVIICNQIPTAESYNTGNYPDIIIDGVNKDDI